MGQALMEQALTLQASMTTITTMEVTGSMGLFQLTIPSLLHIALLARQSLLKSETPRTSSATLKVTSSASPKSLLH